MPPFLTAAFLSLALIANFTLPAAVLDKFITPDGFKQLSSSRQTSLNDENSQLVGSGSQLSSSLSQTAEQESAKANYYPIKKNPLSLGLKISADSAVVLDKSTKRILFQKYAFTPISLASITKLATALYFLKTQPNWQQVIQIQAQDKKDESASVVKVGASYTVKDLFTGGLVSSDNVAIVALARSSGLTEAEYAQEMTKMVSQFGLRETKFSEPTGLSQANVSTAYETALLADLAFEQEPIRDSTVLPEYRFKDVKGREIRAVNTNKLLNSDLTIIGGKTGFLPSVGYNLVLELAGELEQKIIIVILGSQSRQASFDEARLLAEWVFTNYQWLPKN